jgi:hypothetical protein
VDEVPAQGLTTKTLGISRSFGREPAKHNLLVIEYYPSGFMEKTGNVCARRRLAALDGPAVDRVTGDPRGHRVLARVEADLKNAGEYAKDAVSKVRDAVRD